VTGGPEHWRADVPEGWDIRGITNGGFLMAIATRAMEAGTDGRSLISATGTFVNPGTAGSVQVEVQALKTGRTLSTLTAMVSREGKSLVSVTGVYADPDRAIPEEDLMLGHPPDMPGPDSCVEAVPSGDPNGFPPPITGKIEARVHPEDANALLELPGDEPIVRGWFRLRDEEEIDAHGVVLATDCFAPAIFNSRYRAGWTPTIDLAVQVRNPRPAGWLACRFATRFATGGLLEEDGEIWDESGRLVALSRQLALLPR
jgi:acyl-CoA thioesterase